MYVIFLVFLVSIFSTHYGHSTKLLVEQSASFSTNGNETVNASGCTDISANNYNQNATQDDGSCIYQHLGGYEISESIYVEGMMMGLKFNSNGSKYAILQTDNSPGDGKIVVISTNDSENVAIKEIQLNGFDLPIDFDWSPDGSLFVVMFRNMEIITFDSETGDVSDYLFNLNNSSCQSCYNYVHYGEISYNPDGTLVSVLTKYSNSFYLDEPTYGLVINTSNEEIVKLFSTKYGGSTGTWSPDGTRFALKSNNLDSIVFFDTKTWETVGLNISSNEEIYSIDYSKDGEFIAMCSIDKLYVYNASSLANIWTSDIRYCWGIDWSSNSDYLGLIQSYNYGWRLTWQSGPEGWEWYSDGTSITIYNTSTGETVDRLTYGNGNVCPTCDYISYFEWHPFDDYHIISGGTIFDEYNQNSFSREDTWNYNGSIEITFGCMEIYSTNFNPNATRSDGSCVEFDEQDIYQYRADEYLATESSIYYAYWDFCEWSDSEEEFLCWKEDLSALSENMIDELEDCEQSRNGCETEPYCEEIPYGFWGCTNYIPEYWIPPSSDDDQQSFVGMLEDYGEMIFLIITLIITCIVVIVNTNKNDTRVSSVLVDNHEDYIIHQEHDAAIVPTSIEINVRELK